MATIDLTETPFYGRVSQPVADPQRTQPECLACGSQLAGRRVGIRSWGGRLMAVYACRLRPAAADSGPDRGAAVMYLDAARQTLVDPRVVKHGGIRRDPKSNYQFAGMMDAASWRRTLAHQHTTTYGCSLCGRKFAGPHAVYTHLAKIHDR